MKHAYETWNPRDKALDLVEKAQRIVDDYQSQGYDLTLRQLYYQFVARGWLANNERNYKNLGTVLDKARMAGLIDWNAIVDRTRHLAGNQHWESPEEIIRAVGRGYAIDKWEGQPYRVEVWVEKEALAGIVSQVARELDVNYFACRGYVSSSAMYRAAQRISWEIQEGNEVEVIHLGDHDPSGIDMTRDNMDRLMLMVSGNLGRSTRTVPELTINRVALNMDQVLQYNPPPNPAKMSDSRAEEYVNRHGYSSWELDALDPTTLAALIRTTVLALRDEDLFRDKVAEEQEVRSELERLTEVGWPAVRAFLQTMEG
jgi:hypothetical protein